MARGNALQSAMNADMPTAKPNDACSRPNPSSTPHTMLGNASISLGPIAINIARAKSRRFGPSGGVYNTKADSEGLESMVYNSPEISPHCCPGRACGHQGDTRFASIATSHLDEKPSLGLNLCPTISSYIRRCAPLPKCNQSLFT